MQAKIEIVSEFGILEFQNSQTPQLRRRQYFLKNSLRSYILA